MGWSGWVVGHLNAGLERRYFGEDTVLTSICSRVEFLGSRYLPFAGLSWVRLLLETISARRCYDIDYRFGCDFPVRVVRQTIQIKKILIGDIN